VGDTVLYQPAAALTAGVPANIPNKLQIHDSQPPEIYLHAGKMLIEI
jgi:hypothetical protein